MKPVFAFLAAVVMGCAHVGCSEPAKPAEAPKPTDSPVAAKTETTKDSSKPDIKEIKIPEKPKKDIDNRLYPLDSLKKVTLKAGSAPEVNLWVMDDPGKEAEGMMYLSDSDVKENEGMIFVFPDEDNRSFWMENTKIGLDIIFISQAGKVLNIQKGVPMSRESLPSEGKAKYVVELKSGRGAKFGFVKGATIAIPKL